MIKNALAMFMGLILVGLFVGCVPTTQDELGTASDNATPTLHPFFEKPTESPVQSTPDLDTSDPAQEETPVATLAAAFVAATRESELQLLTGFSYSDLITKIVFADELNSNWILLEEEGMTVDLTHTDPIYNGRYAISATPLDTFQRAYFGVSEETTESYAQDDVYAISFLLSGGDEYLELDDWAFTIVGSNDFPYWVADDTSAYLEGDEEFPFSESALYWFDLNSDVPPNNWVEVEVPVHELIYDPAYRYITGFYLKNGDDAFNPIYIDDVRIIKFPGTEESSIINREIDDGGEAESISTPDPAIILTSTITVPVTSSLNFTDTIDTSNGDTEPETDPEGEGNDCVVERPSNWQIYTVQTGDTFSSLSLRANVAIDRILTVNCLNSDSVLAVNQRIWLPPIIEPTLPPTAPIPILTPTP